eukprot:13033837-Alexandrium_andersonii.AAC.1
MAQRVTDVGAAAATSDRRQIRGEDCLEAAAGVVRQNCSEEAAKARRNLERAEITWPFKPRLLGDPDQE